jgi:hypothetical protein
MYAANNVAGFHHSSPFNSEDGQNAWICDDIWEMRVDVSHDGLRNFGTTADQRIWLLRFRRTERKGLRLIVARTIMTW